MKSSMDAFEAKIKYLLSVAPTPEAYETLVDFKEMIEVGWRLCDEYHERKNVVLIESLEKIQDYAHDRLDRELELIAWKALKEYRGEV